MRAKYSPAPCRPSATLCGRRAPASLPAAEVKPKTGSETETQPQPKEKQADAEAHSAQGILVEAEPPSNAPPVQQTMKAPVAPQPRNSRLTALTLLTFAFVVLLVAGYFYRFYSARSDATLPGTGTQEPARPKQ